VEFTGFASHGVKSETHADSAWSVGFTVERGCGNSLSEKSVERLHQVEFTGFASQSVKRAWPSSWNADYLDRRRRSV